VRSSFDTFHVNDFHQLVRPRQVRQLALETTDTAGSVIALGSSQKRQVCLREATAPTIGPSADKDHQPNITAPCGPRATSAVTSTTVTPKAVAGIHATLDLSTDRRVPKNAGSSANKIRKAAGNPSRYKGSENTTALAGLRTATVVLPSVPANTTNTNAAYAVRREADATANPMVQAHKMSAEHSSANAAMVSNKSQRAPGLARYAHVQLST
jgi:hypothetical protein